MAISAIQKKREEIVLEHMQAENVHDYDTVIDTFSRPRYELIGTGQIFDGEEEVRGYFEKSRAPFPDQRNELINLIHGENEIIVELWLMGTHTGNLTLPTGELPPTGKAFKLRICAIFEFDDEKITCERVYFDQTSLAAQLLG